MTEGERALKPSQVFFLSLSAIAAVAANLLAIIGVGYPVGSLTIVGLTLSIIVFGCIAAVQQRRGSSPPADDED